MKIDSLLLTDVLIGQANEPDMVHGTGLGPVLYRETQADPGLRDILWFLEFISRTPGKLESLRVSVRENDDDDDSYCSPSDDLFQTLRFLQRDSYSVTSHCFSEQIKANIRKAMAAHAATVRATLADTKVSKLISKELDLALTHKVPLPIIGDSRFGKTKAGSVWCDAAPGRARLVTVPESNREWDFYAAHADALGVAYNDRTRIQTLKRSVQHVIKHNGLFLCYDEAHFLVPVNYQANTPPKRINFVRCHVIDQGIGCAFFATPQSLDQTLERYAAKTRYNLEQWLGRLAPPLLLANYYDRAELMAVARVHFPEFPEKPLALICARAMQAETYLKGMEFTARYASALAQDRARRKPTVQDVDEAIERMMPAKTATAAADGMALASERPASERGQRRFKQPLTPPSRAVLDDAGGDGEAENFAGRRAGLSPDLGRPAPRRAARDLVAA